MRFVRRLAFAVAVALLSVTAVAHAETRVALVIGNGAYASPMMPRLANPPHDAVAVGNTLKALGFDVDVVTDATKEAMEDALARLARRARDADITLIFYAGHGLQDQGKNYFAPVDATLSDETDLRRRFVRLDDVLDDLDRAKGARILLLDACRDNGAVDALRAAVPQSRSAGISRGLARIPEAEGQLVAFATQPDRVAADGEGADSPFTTALLAHLGEPGIELRMALTRVRVDVAKATNNDQIPEVSDSLLGEIYLRPLTVPAAAPSGATPPPAAVNAGPAAAGNAQIAADYQAAAAVGTATAWQLFLKLHGAETDDFHVGPARENLLKLAPQAAVASAGPPAGPPDPSADLLGQIKAHAGRVCPLVCGAAYEAKGDSCVRRSCPPGMTMGSRGECKAPPRQATPANPSGGNKTATAGASGGGCSTGYYPCKLNANGRLDATHPNCCLNVPGFGHAK
jgi:uncharacterized caspase-like protein